MPILNYTTSVDSYKTITSITQILSKKGASKIVFDNNSEGFPVSLTFQIVWMNSPVAFVLPCNYQGVLKAMRKDRKIPRKYLTEEQALKVSWRILKDWVEAQLAIVESEMCTLAEVFLPYAVTKNGTTLYRSIENNRDILLLE